MVKCWIFVVVVEMRCWMLLLMMMVSDGVDDGVSS